MNIAIVLQGGVDRGGEQRVIPVVLALLGRLAARHEVHVFALQQEPRPANWMLRGAHVHNIGSTKAVHRTVGAILRQHGRRRFDIIHALWSGSGALCASLAARLLGLPLLVHLTGGELIHLPDIRYGMHGSLKGRLVNRWVFAHAACITATSEPMVRLAAARGVCARRVPLGIALDEWPRREPVARTAGEPARLIQVATLNRVKDHAATLAALRLLADRGHAFTLDVIGEDTLHGEVQTLARRHGLEGVVTFHGFLTQSQLRPLLERAQAHIVSSLHEAGPAVALEAAIVGVPTVGTAVGHLVEWAPEAALAVAPRDVVALAAGIEAVIRDETLRIRLARAAQARALAEDADFTAREFEALYREYAQPHVGRRASDG